MRLVIAITSYGFLTRIEPVVDRRYAGLVLVCAERAMASHADVSLHKPVGGTGCLRTAIATGRKK